MLTLDWMQQYDAMITQALRDGRVSGSALGVPDRVFESGLAHIFFYGDTVYKLYKTHSEKDHFIKGVLAPTDRRTAFLQHDFTLNQHFSRDVYRVMHSIHLVGDSVEITPYDGASIYTLVEMSRLDFDTNLHERLLRSDISTAELELIGFETARAIATCPVTAPDEVNWYDLAKERVGFLEQFVDWLPEAFAVPVKESAVIDTLYAHLEKYRDEYQSLTGNELAVNIDNHDENIFFIDGKPQFIDLLPPMSCWWYGLPYANLSNVMANVEALHSLEAAESVKRGYSRYHNGVEPPTHRFGFTHAFAYLISIAHFGSVPKKESVTKRYLAHLDEITGWL